MISDAIETLAAMFADREQTGLTLSPKGVGLWRKVLDDTAERVRRLEAAVVPAGARSDFSARAARRLPANGKVVALDAHRARRAARRPGGGTAA